MAVQDFLTGTEGAAADNMSLVSSAPPHDAVMVDLIYEDPSRPLAGAST